MKKKVLFTASTASHLRDFHLPYLRWFREQGWEVHAACGGDGAVPEADKVYILPFRKSMTAPGNFQAAAMLRNIIRAEGYSLISTHTSLAAFSTRLAVKGMTYRPPLVDTVHGYLFDDDTPTVRRGMLLAAERLLAPETDLLLTMDEWDEALARRYRLGKRIGRIPGMGVDFSKLDGYTEENAQALRKEWGIPEDAFVVVYAAEFSGRKSQWVLIRALVELPEECVLALPGDGALLERCRRLVAELGLTGRVVFPGRVADMGRWYAMADAAASASRSEGLPFNVMEAMHCGLPVVASAVKGHTDLVRDGANGLLYPYGDIRACARAIRALMEDRGLCSRLGSQACEDAEPYRLERVMPLVLEQLKTLPAEETVAEVAAGR